MNNLFAEPIPQNNRTVNRNHDSIPFEVVDMTGSSVVPISSDVQIISTERPTIIPYKKSNFFFYDGVVTAGRISKKVVVWTAVNAGQLFGVLLVLSGHVLYYCLLFLGYFVRGLTSVVGSLVGIGPPDMSGISGSNVRRRPSVNVRTDVNVNSDASVNVSTNVNVN